MEEDAGTVVFLPDDDHVWVPATISSVDDNVSPAVVQQSFAGCVSQRNDSKAIEV